MAGTDLIPAMDYEIAAINISVNDETMSVIKNGNGSNPDDDGLPVFAWHRDSYPFVCVTMLSDCTGMTGGETALKSASGEIMKVRGPSMVRCSPAFCDIMRKSSFANQLQGHCRRDARKIYRASGTKSTWWSRAH